MARALFFARPAFYLRRALASSGELAAVFYGAVRLVRPEVIVPATGGKGSEHFERLLRSKLHPNASIVLREAVDDFLAAGEDFDPDAWMMAADASARNLAVLLTGDLGIGISAIGDDEIFMGYGERRMMRDMIARSVSLEHLRLRETLGIRNVDSE
jgi:hypothetical protein